MGWFWGLFTEGIVSHFIDGVGGEFYRCSQVLWPDLSAALLE